VSGNQLPDGPPPADATQGPWPQEAPWAAPGGAAHAPRPLPDGGHAPRTVPAGAPGVGRPTAAGLARTDPVSVAALVTGVLPTGPVAAVLGVLGIRRTGRGGRPGRALAVVGLVLGLAWSVVAVAAGVSLLRGPALDGDVPEPVGRASAHLREGNCVRNLPVGGEVRRVSLVPCADPHTAQVIHVGALAQEAAQPEDTYADARVLCQDAAAATDTQGEDVEVVTLAPTSGTSPVVCLVEWPTPVQTDLVN